MLARIGVVLAVVLSLIVLPGLPAFAGPQDDPQPPVDITPGDGSWLPNNSKVTLTLTLAEALADQTLESGQAAQALAAAAAARRAALSDTDSPAADGSAVSTAAADTSWRSRERPDLAGWAAVIRCHQQIALAEPSFRTTGLVCQYSAVPVLRVR